MKKIEATIKPESVNEREINTGSMERRQQQQQQPQQQSVFAG